MCETYARQGHAHLCGLLSSPVRINPHSCVRHAPHYADTLFSGYLNISHTCVERHLKKLGYVNELDIWVPHKLNDIQLTKGISVCWDFKGIVYFELLPRNQTINSNFYCLQLMKLDKEIKEKRPELATREDAIFHQDNHFNGKTFDSNEAVKNELIQFFASENQTCYESGIMKLSERWQKVIEQNGQCIID